MLQREWAPGDDGSVDGLVVAGGVAVYRDLVAGCLGAPAVTSDSIGDARFVVLCANGHCTAQIEALAEHPDRRVLVIGVADDDAARYFEAGAFDVLPADAGPEAIRSASQGLISGERRLSTRQTSLIFARLRERKSAGPEDHARRLTSRELDIAKLLAEGLCNKEIAGRLCISVSTVKKHVHRTLQKLGVRDRRGVAALLPR